MNEYTTEELSQVIQHTADALQLTCKEIESIKSSIKEMGVALLLMNQMIIVMGKEISKLNNE